MGSSRSRRRRKRSRALRVPGWYYALLVAIALVGSILIIISLGGPGVDTGDQITRPQMEVLGTLESGIPFGTTSDGDAFKGDPEAPVMIIEFSDYQ